MAGHRGSCPGPCKRRSPRPRTPPNGPGPSSTRTCSATSTISGRGADAAPSGRLDRPPVEGVHMTDTVSGALSALRGTADLLDEAHRGLPAADPGATAFGAGGPGRLGEA